MKKSVIIEGQKSRSSIRNGKSFNRMDQKSQLQIKKIIQASKTSERLDLSERNILSLNSQIADLNETLKGKLKSTHTLRPQFQFSASSTKESHPKFTKWIRMSSITRITGSKRKQSHFSTRFIRLVEKNVDGPIIYLLHLRCNIYQTLLFQHEKANLQKLKRLDLRHNKIEGNLPNVIYQMSSIVQLFLNFNKISQIQPGIANLNQLVNLDLRYVPEILEKLWCLIFYLVKINLLDFQVRLDHSNVFPHWIYQIIMLQFYPLKYLNALSSVYLILATINSKHYLQI